MTLKINMGSNRQNLSTPKNQAQDLDHLKRSILKEIQKFDLTAQQKKEVILAINQHFSQINVNAYSKKSTLLNLIKLNILLNFYIDMDEIFERIGDIFSNVVEKIETIDFSITDLT